MKEQPVARPLPAYRTAQTQNKCTQTSMPKVGFEPTTPVLERAKTVHVLDHAVTVIGMDHMYTYIKQMVKFKEINFNINHFISRDLETDKI
jgi:hypothetical protein